jgi:hypothetical protein
MVAQLLKVLVFPYFGNAILEAAAVFILVVSVFLPCKFRYRLWLSGI